MTCVLSVPALFTNPFSENGGDLRKKEIECESFDFNWINAQQTLSGLSDNQRCSPPCHLEAGTSSSISCRTEISSGLSESDKHEQLHLHAETDIKAIVSEMHVPIHGRKCTPSLLEMCTRTGLQQNNMHVTGLKRKADITECEEVYIPSKRVSPFLNTPKERKDERKKILKISLRKLRQLEDPESFLRRTVLVNNTTKRLQTELRIEKLRSRKFASNKSRVFGEYGVLSNDCLYLFDDPFLSGVPEKITDDMTDTLIRNVFRDKQNDKGKECDIGDEMEVLDEQQIVESNLATLRGIYRDTTDQSSIDRSTIVKQSCSLTCLDNETDIQTMADSRVDELELVNKVNKSSDNSKTAGLNDSDTINIGQRKLYERIPLSVMQNTENDKHTGSDEIQTADIIRIAKATDIQRNFTDIVENHLYPDIYIHEMI